MPARNTGIPYAILDVLAGRELSTAEIGELLPEARPQTIRNAVSQMVRDGRLERVDPERRHSGRYRVVHANPLDDYLGLRPMLVGPVRRVCGSRP